MLLICFASGQQRTQLSKMATVCIYAVLKCCEDGLRPISTAFQLTSMICSCHRYMVRCSRVTVADSRSRMAHRTHAASASRRCIVCSKESCDSAATVAFSLLSQHFSPLRKAGGREKPASGRGALHTATKSSLHHSNEVMNCIFLYLRFFGQTLVFIHQFDFAYVRHSVRVRHSRVTDS